MTQEITTFSDAFDKLAEGLITTQQIQVGSFKDFLLNIWSQSFEHPEYFNAWHVGQIADDIEYCLEKGLNYCAVLPRFHFKSTILGHAFSVWSLLKSPRDCAVLYLSYSDSMARYHISEINKAISRNPILTQWMVNRSPKADFSARYYVNNKPMDVRHGGLFSFKRGMHVNGALIADDILRDPENPLNIGQVTKVEDHFLTESMFIPLKGVPVLVMGTPMMPGDLLGKLQEDDRFFTRVLPALDPVPGRRVLMPELYSEEWLLQQQRARPKSFASEFLLVPHFATESFFNDADISKCEDETLRDIPTTRKYKKPEDSFLFAGFDVGKKRHPSHLVIFLREGEKVTQIHQSWLDGWNYSDQIEFLNEVAENFDLDRGYIDNTRGELEDRGLDSRWHSLSFTLKSKNNMAHIFEEYVHSGQLKLLKDSRQKQQILSVNNELKAPETPMGHGDAFFSIGMALLASWEVGKFGVLHLGNLQGFLDPEEPAELKPEAEQTPVIEDITSDKPGSMELPGGVQVDYDRGINADLTMADCPNPNCEEIVCKPAFWVPERKLCIFCGHRG
jgi:hypothetical protein